MKTKLTETFPTVSISAWVRPHHVALITMWLLTTIVYAIMLSTGVRDTMKFQFERNALQAAYVATLLWYLGHTGLPTKQLPELHPAAFSRWRFAVWIPVLGIAILFLMTALTDGGFNTQLNLMVIALAPIIIIWRREIRLRSIIQGLGFAAIAFVAVLPLVENGFVSEAGYLFAIFVLPMYVAGGLLFNHTRLGGIQTLAKQYLPALRSFLWGCLLFVPLGLANAAGGSPSGPNFTWVSEWWMPFSLPIWSGIVEETWFRLFLVGLVYWLLRPAFQEHPGRAVLLAVLFSGITFGLGHDRTLERFLTTGLLFGVPYAVAFARRDLEHAVGAHYMVNLIPWVMVYLKT